MEQKIRPQGSDYFPIIIEDEREVSTKQNQTWSLGKAHWYNFRKKVKLQQKCGTKTQLKKHTAA